MNNAGAGVSIYILDSGVKLNHVTFEDRASILGGFNETDFSPYTAQNRVSRTTK
jgi:subtilisin family serine protease